jgi:hypothetical protein
MAGRLRGGPVEATRTRIAAAVVRRARLALAATLGIVLVAAMLGGSAATAVAVPYRDVVLADNPAGYWRLGESSGTVAADATGGGNPGTYLGGVTLGVPGGLPGDPDRAARLDGSNDRVSMGDPASGVLDFGTSDFTVELWLRTSVNQERLVVGKRASGRPGLQPRPRRRRRLAPRGRSLRPRRRDQHLPRRSRLGRHRGRGDRRREQYG